MTFSGWVATLAGWYVTEIGRQPWLVYGVLRTADAAAPNRQPMIGTSLALYLMLYALLIVAYVSVLVPPGAQGRGAPRHAWARCRSRWQPTAGAEMTTPSPAAAVVFMG